jgi:hypothetical protein
MATHTETANYSGRKFTIARKNGQQDKDGEPYFSEWIKEIPQVQPNSKRIFETRPKKDKTDHFELFQKIDGFVVGARKNEVNYGSEIQTNLWVFMVDGEEDYTLDLGKFDGRYSMDFCKRVLDANFDPTKRISLQPYAIFDKTKDRWNIGVSVFSGPNKMDAKVDSPHLVGMPQAEKEETRAGVNWYFDKQANWLVEKMCVVLAAGLSDPISFKQTEKVEMPVPAENYDSRFPANDTTDHEQGAQPGDDLPF